MEFWLIEMIQMLQTILKNGISRGTPTVVGTLDYVLIVPVGIVYTVNDAHCIISIIRFYKISMWKHQEFRDEDDIAL
jgi:hypothetical protein